MYKNILVPVSFDDTRNAEGSLEVARLLADKDATVTIIHVMEQVPAYAISYLPHGYIAQSRMALTAQLAEMADTVPGGKGELIEGHSGRSILEYADEHDIDCVVIASHRPGAADLVLGSTAARVVRHAKCAVHVVR